MSPLRTSTCRMPPDLPAWCAVRASGNTAAASELGSLLQGPSSSALGIAHQPPVPRRLFPVSSSRAPSFPSVALVPTQHGHDSHLGQLGLHSALWSMYVDLPPDGCPLPRACDHLPTSWSLSPSGPDAARTVSSHLPSPGSSPSLCSWCMCLPLPVWLTLPCDPAGVLKPLHSVQSPQDRLTAVPQHRHPLLSLSPPAPRVFSRN